MGTIEPLRIPASYLVRGKRKRANELCTSTSWVGKRQPAYRAVLCTYDRKWRAVKNKNQGLAPASAAWRTSFSTVTTCPWFLVLSEPHSYAQFRNADGNARLEYGDVVEPARIDQPHRRARCTGSNKLLSFPLPLMPLYRVWGTGLQ